MIQYFILLHFILDKKAPSRGHFSIVVSMEWSQIEWSGGGGGSKIIDVGFNFNTDWLKR